MKNRKNMDLTKSSIVKDTKLWMYKFDFWFYSKYFDYCVFSWKYNMYNYSYGKKPEKAIIEDWFVLDDYGIWFTKFLDYVLVGIMNLKTLNITYFIVKTCYLFHYNIRWNTYFFFSYLDINWKWKLFHNCNLKDFEIILDTSSIWPKMKFEIDINNKMLWVLANKKLFYLNKNEEYIDNNLDINSYDLNIVDLYFFEDYFYDKEIDLNDLFLIFNNKVIKSWLDYIATKIYKYDNPIYPRYVLKIYTKSDFVDMVDCRDLLRFFLTFLPKQHYVNIIENKKIEELFCEYFEDVNNIELDKFSIDFSVPENIYEYDENFLLFQENLIKLRYIYFNLSYHLDLINGNNIDQINNFHIDISKIRLSMNKENLEIMIKKYDEIFLTIINKIKAIKW